MYLEIVKSSLLCAVLLSSLIKNQSPLAATNSAPFSKRIILRQIKPFEDNAFRLFLTFTGKQDTYHTTRTVFKRDGHIEEYYPETDFYELLPKYLCEKEGEYIQTSPRQIAWIDVQLKDNKQGGHIAYIENCSELPITEEEHVDFINTLGLLLNNIDLDEIPWQYHKPNKNPTQKPIQLNPSIEFVRVKAKDHEKTCYYSDVFVRVQPLNHHNPFYIPVNQPFETTQKTLQYPYSHLSTQKSGSYLSDIVDREKSTESESSFNLENNSATNDVDIE